MLSVLATFIACLFLALAALKVDLGPIDRLGEIALALLIYFLGGVSWGSLVVERRP